MSSARTVRLFLVLVFTAGFALAPGAAPWRQSLIAQDRVYEPYDSSAVERGWQEVDAYVSVVDGSARLERAGDVIDDFEQVPLEVGDALRTTRGRVEVLFSDGSVIALDEYTEVTIDDPAAWRLHGGRVKVTWRAGTFDLNVAPAGAARLRTGGEYRITLADSRRGERELEVAVTRGSADLENALGRTQVRAGTRALTTASYAPSVPYAFSVPRDDFERWTESLESDRYGVESARYLPVELRYYGGEFDRHGYWSHLTSYGWVWYPRVSVGWQPYRSGRWTFIVNFGYNWVGGTRWDWPTHHYGRWDRAGARWFWVPSRPTQPRRVGFAVPRPSYSAPVSYYQTQRVRQVQPVQQVQQVQRVPQGRQGRQGSQTRQPESPQRRPQLNQQRPQENQPRSAVQQPRAVPRESQVQRVPQDRQVPQGRTQSRPTVRRPEPQAQQRPRQAETTRPSAPQRSRQVEPARPSAPQRSRQAPTPRASEPPRSGPARTGSRTPSAGRAPSAPSRQPSGTAVRRRGGRG